VTRFDIRQLNNTSIGCFENVSGKAWNLSFITTQPPYPRPTKKLSHGVSLPLTIVIRCPYDDIRQPVTVDIACVTHGTAGPVVCRNAIDYKSADATFDHVEVDLTKTRGLTGTRHRWADTPQYADRHGHEQFGSVCRHSDELIDHLVALARRLD
jgi:hypothetical protein